MKIKVPYGKDHVTVTVDDSRVAGIVNPNPVECGDEQIMLKRALDQPLKSESFSDFMAGDAKTLFIVNDGTRPTPTAKILDLLEDDIRGKGCEYIIATGCHRAPTEEEYDFMFGKHYPSLKKKDRIIVHDAKNEDDLVFIGTSTNGTRMRVNKHALEADRIVIIGSVEPHYFGGYTGGRKAFLPGVAAYDTITMNHKFALKPEASALALEGNPVHEDMIDALKYIQDKKIFSIQTVLDQHRRIYAVTAGDIFASMDAAVEAANEVFAVKIPRKEDIVVSVAPYPMDVDLYQSQKALDNGKLALNDGGILIMVSKCRTGIGPDTFFKLLSSCDTPEEVIAKIDREFKLGYHKAAKMAEIGLWAKVWAVSELDPDLLRKIFITPYKDLQTAIDDALEAAGPDARVLFMPEGSITVPMISSN